MTERLHFHFLLSCTGKGNGNSFQCSCLENPRDGGARWAAVYFSVLPLFLLLQFSSVQFSSVAQSCPTLCDPMDCSLPGSSIYGIFQARVLEWGAIAFSNSQYIRLQISNQPTIVNLISKYESFIHLGCLLGIFYVQFILLRTPWNRKGTSLPPDNEQAEVARGWWNLLQGPCFHPQDCEDPDSLLSTPLHIMRSKSL